MRAMRSVVTLVPAARRTPQRASRSPEYTPRPIAGNEDYGDGYCLPLLVRTYDQQPRDNRQRITRGRVSVRSLPRPDRYDLAARW